MSAPPDAAPSLGTAGAERAASAEPSASTTAVGRGDGPGDIDCGALPRIFGDYTLLDRLASGGMGQVYRAARREAGPDAPPVAIKRVLPELAADADFIARFVSEAQIARTLDHPNIVRVLEHGELGGEHYLVMEFIDGADLAALLAACARRALPLPLPAALMIAVAMARGLGAAHRRRVGEQPAPVVHRDISPQNVLVARDGTVKVTDFGIAQRRLFRGRRALRDARRAPALSRQQRRADSATGGQRSAAAAARGLARLSAGPDGAPDRGPRP
ncbi:MAG: serine/threonine protein kinase [Proteobacteria bacterium]|nr:serine/threonine protein kinase [Pseudomonadota bacterium]